MVGDVEIKDDVPTACTNGRDVMYGRAFIDKLSESNVKGVILHENLHKAFRHTTMFDHFRSSSIDNIVNRVRYLSRSRS